MPLTYEEQAARIVLLESQLAPLAAERDAALAARDAALAENSRLLRLVPPDSDGTGMMTVSEYRYHTVAAYRALGVLPSSTANTALKAKWDYILRGLESLDQARRINTRVAPFLTITNEMFTDNLIAAAKRDFLNTFGA